MTYREPKTFQEILEAAFRGKRVSWRTYGLHGEKRRPMFHRFPVKGGDTVMEVMKGNLTRGSPLFDLTKERAP